MSGSDLVLILFLLAPVVTAAGARLAARAYGRAERGRGLLLVVGNTAVMLTLAGLGLLGAELYYRYVYDTTDGFQISMTSQRWVERHYARNDLGVRDDVDYARAVPPGRTRITFLGDSYTAGYGVRDVDERFVNLLRHRHPEWDIHSLARDGLDTGELLATLQRYLQAGYRIDRVVYAYCLNDISDIIPEWAEIAGRIYRERPGFWVDHSFAVNTWYWRLRAAGDPVLADYFDRLVDAYNGPIWDAHRKRLDRLSAIVERHGGELQVVIFPFYEFLDSETFRSIHGQVSAHFEARGVAVLDLLPVYAAHPAETLIVNRYDTHPNEFAHEIAAQEIERMLRQPPRRK